MTYEPLDDDCLPPESALKELGFEGLELGESLCPMCSGDGVYLGSLGTREFFRCQSCGIEFSR
jgi:tRNA(Ile2) C34 agmatinyltransferase TiaS